MRKKFLQEATKATETENCGRSPFALFASVKYPCLSVSGRDAAPRCPHFQPGINHGRSLFTLFVSVKYPCASVSIRG